MMLPQSRDPRPLNTLTLTLTLALAALGATGASPVRAGETEADPLVLPFELDQELARWAKRIAPAELTPTRRLRAISKALLDPGRIGLREALDRTPTAIEAFRDRRANCVGFASLFVGLAREAGVPAFFVMIEDLGRSRKKGSLLVTERHLAAAYGPPDRLRVFDFAGETDGGLYHLIPVHDLTAMAFFYSNRGVESMLDGGDEQAVRWLRKAVALDPALAAARINLGVALRRTGDLKGAEIAYQEALRIDPGAGAAYRSLAALLRLRGRAGEAEALLVDAAHLEQGDPLSYLSLARRSLETGDVDEARGLYRKALELSQRQLR